MLINVQAGICNMLNRIALLVPERRLWGPVSTETL